MNLLWDRLRKNPESLKMKNTLEVLDNYLETSGVGYGLKRRASQPREARLFTSPAPPHSSRSGRHAARNITAAAASASAINRYRLRSRNTIIRSFLITAPSPLHLIQSMPGDGPHMPAAVTTR